MFLADNWKDYEVIDTSGGEKLERWGDYVLVRPDPQVIWNTPRTDKRWSRPNGHYHRSNKGGGEWEFFDLPDEWTIRYKELTFCLKIKVLNLFAYTGGATISAAAAGAKVTHVDAAKGMVGWAKENAKASGLEDAPIRWLVDDCVKFVERESRRGNKYDGIIMDPPSYGRGPKGEIWKLEDCVFPLLEKTAEILADNPLFVLVNSYTTGLQPAVLSYMMNTVFVNRFGGHVEAGEVGLPVTGNNLVLPCGASGRYTA